MSKVLNKSYQEFFSWRNKLGQHSLAHHDGTVSTMLAWDGIDHEFHNDQSSWGLTDPLFHLLHHLEPQYFYEFHWWREKNDRAVDEYLSYNDKHIRGGEIAKFMRYENAEHIRPYVHVNDAALVVSHTPAALTFLRPFLSTKKQLRNQTRRAAQLQNAILDYLPYLPGGRLLSNDDYEQRILRTTHRDMALGGMFSADPTVFLNHQWVRKPDLLDDDALLKTDGLYHKIIFAPLYPDAAPGWFANLSAFSINMHVVMGMKPLPASTALRQSENAAKLAGSDAASHGQVSISAHKNEEKAFQSLLVDNNLSAYRNFYVIHLYDENKDHVLRTATQIKNIFAKGGATDMSRRYQYPYYRLSQPGLGYMANDHFLRKDHTWQVGSMIPSQVYRTGSKNGEQLRLGFFGQPVSLSYQKDKVNHSLTSAKTGSGKDVEKQHTIFEVWPLGTNIYAMEVGTSYQWSFTALAGPDAYISVDPDNTAVSPFPSYHSADPTSSRPLNVRLVAGTVRAIAFVLLDDPHAGNINFKLPVAHRAAAQEALRMLYAVPTPGQDAPLFEDYRNILADPFYLDGKTKQMDAAKAMAENLDNFLSTDEGRLFNQPTNVDLNPDLMGINLKPVVDMPSLFSYYLVFFSLRLSQMAAMRPFSSRFILNEFHVFVKQCPDIIGGLMDGISRMGRKEGQSLDLVTQETEEMDVVSAAIINSLAHRVLLYREGYHQELGKRLNLPESVCDLWAKFAEPSQLNFRNCIRSMDSEYYNLFLTYPETLLNMTSTNESQQAIREEIFLQTSDPFERLQRLYEATHALPN